MARTPRNNFHFLRLAAALLVVYGHEGVDATGTAGMRLLVFFSISGYLIAGSWKADPHAGRFLQRRLLRLWPAYAVAIVTCAALSCVFPALDLPGLSRLASAFYLSNLWFSGFDWGFFPFRNALMNQSLWMMRFEVDFYLAFALLGIVRPRVVPYIAAAVVVLAATSRTDAEQNTGGLLECWSLHFAGFFAFGVLMREFPALRRSGPVALLVLAGMALLTLGHWTAGLLFIIPPATVWFGERSWPGLRSAARYGDLSLGIFLWAWPVHQVTHLWLDPATPMLARFAIVAVQAMALAWLSWHFIEAPALSRKPARPTTRPERATAPATA